MVAHPSRPIGQCRPSAQVSTKPGAFQESNHHSARQRLYRPLSSPMLSVRVRVTDRDRTGASRPTTSDAAVTPRSPRSGDDRARTGALSPDKRALYRLSYAPGSSAGGIRTHGLELMRLTRTAAPPPRFASWPRRLPPGGARLRRHSPRWLHRAFRGRATCTVPSGPAPPASRQNTKQVWPAGVEPAISGARSRWGGQLPYDQTIEIRRQGSNLRSRG